MNTGLDVDVLILLVSGALIGGLVLGLLVASLRVRRQLNDPGGEALHWAADQAVLREGIARLGDQMRDLEHQRVSWQSQLHEQVRTMVGSTEVLRRETAALGSALRKPQVRGQWGEMQLRRTVELAGMVNHVDFHEQSSTALADGGHQRPDLVVHLAGDRHIVVDAKVPLDGFLDATQNPDDPAVHEQHLARHARQVRAHIDGLATKRYWREQASTPEFVVMFIPAEAFLSAALDTQTDLIEYAAARQVIVATPTTLIALLRTVAHGWRHVALTAQADQIHQLGLLLYSRLGTLSGHLDHVGRALDAAVGSYNQAIGSYESRVLVAARRFEDVIPPSDKLASPRQATSAARSLGVVPLDRRGSDTDQPPSHTVAL